jgi:hypothetical protein
LDYRIAMLLGLHMGNPSRTKSSPFLSGYPRTMSHIHFAVQRDKMFILPLLFFFSFLLFSFAPLSVRSCPVRPHTRLLQPPVAGLIYTTPVPPPPMQLPTPIIPSSPAPAPTTPAPCPRLRPSSPAPAHGGAYTRLCSKGAS